ncbi:DUF421 domain-containing protein [Cupriavidus basilensis]|uniref:DUF421 domain-containing protein n=1 Tax=Cupriavidus basilensis TaxID=68895 RepID=A0A643G271_9BURK|nr:YetF domain-containing protein [Cupriavidus basilensis]QOT81915.1 DUF421 domain-containing protein [Cupriavidus basilensis]
MTAANVLETLFAATQHPIWWQAMLRAAVVFVIAWALLRLAGRRSFAQKTSFDLCIMLLLGAVLSRAVVGATSMGTATGASAVLVLMHRSVGWLATRFSAFDRIVGGNPIELLSKGTLDRDALARTEISERDLAANLRESLQTESLSGVDRIVVERDGKISFVRRANVPESSDS